jgi:hypothetical protein
VPILCFIGERGLRGKCALSVGEGVSGGRRGPAVRSRRGQIYTYGC